MKNNQPPYQYLNIQSSLLFAALASLSSQQQQGLPAPTTPAGTAAVFDGTYFNQHHISPANHPAYPQTPDGQGINNNAYVLAAPAPAPAPFNTPHQFTPIHLGFDETAEDTNEGDYSFTSTPSTPRNLKRQRLNQNEDENTDEYDNLPAQSSNNLFGSESPSNEAPFMTLADIANTPAVLIPATPGTAGTNWGVLTPSTLNMNFMKALSDDGTSQEAPSSDDGDKKPSANDMEIVGTTLDDEFAEFAYLDNI